ncbi:hypothetical protein G7Y89_g4675 [Cudoniella acicularis]|uniref:AAA+ ATPase domain-containing protein n=1 Tax=Cudoniella acicularis TaxID=354080 RepID=A0A8H4RS06_9HELO|nr:hypothetical protein G7Y89_g4675 [Cudoniella acicularis]
MGELNEGKKKVYPLFQKQSRTQDVNSENIEVQIRPVNIEPQSQKITKKASAQPNRKPKKGSAIKDSNITAALEEEHVQAELLEVDPNEGRKKRQKTASLGHDDDDLDYVEENNFAEERLGQGAKRGRPAKAKDAKGGAPPIQKSAKPKPKDPSASQMIPAAFNRLSAPGNAKVGVVCILDELNRSQALEVLGKEPSKATVMTTETPVDDSKIISGSKDHPLELEPNSNDQTNSRPKKILKFNPKTGTIGSPPAKKTTVSKTASGSPPKSQLVVIRYGEVQHLPFEVGLKIDQILNSPKSSLRISQNKTQQKVVKPATSNPPKPVHPLFLGKAAMKTVAPKEDNPQPVIPDAGNATAQPNAGRTRTRTLGRPATPPKSAAPMFSGFGKSAGILKFPGAIEPAWPWQGMIHVRGNPPASELSQTPFDHLSKIQPKTKKAKYQAIVVQTREDVIRSLRDELAIPSVIESIREINPDEFPPVPPCLRIPAKHYEGGSAIQRRVCKELRSKLLPPRPAPLGSTEDGVIENPPSQSQTHPALLRTYNSIATSLSAFDQGQCETQSWTQKYSPKCASEVLQSGREALILKDWLQTLVVKSVESGAGEKPRSRGSSLSRSGSKAETNGKRKRKSKKLDGFVVSSDEEDNDMDEITDPEEDISAFGGPALLKKTVIRAGDVARGPKESARLTNAIVMSGPHGCGKTASVYAVAKELGFEIFEINSSSRRSGKDILEKVGDMTRNHLVQQSHAQTQADEDNERLDEAFEKDLKSGRQGTMNSFFKPKEESKPKPKPKKQLPVSMKTATKIEDMVPKAPAKKQKQSLILIEEADILYEEDKQFWATIIPLVAQSKRPVIITCNNESAIPIQSLLLYAIIRFNPPPIDLAVDYLLLVAACEGHVIRRDAVKALYESRDLDLRSSLTELNFWCQFAIGDCKNGLDWFYPRWPKGGDVNEDGEIIRVVSEGTYETGMGWLSQDVLESHSHYLDIEEEILHEAWDGFHLDVGDWQKTLDLESWAGKFQKLSNGKVDDQAALGIYEDFADAMSAADLCSGRTFAPENQVLVDVNLPALSTKAREDYILAHQVIEASPLVDFSTLTEDISLWMKSRARKYLHIDQHAKHGFEIPTELDRPSEADIIHLITERVTSPESTICRRDFSLAFDPVSEPEKTLFQSTTTLEASSFDRTFNIITTDLAPYVRSIVACDARLQQDRARLSNLLSEGGRKGKRMRTTRAAMSALEGGARSTTRRDRYFGSKLNAQFVLNTGMQSWTDAALELEKAGRKAGEKGGGGYGCEWGMMLRVKGAKVKVGGNPGVKVRVGVLGGG